MLRSAWRDAAAWDREYSQIQAIPSSFRMTPSRALRRLMPAIGALAGARVLDVGAGTGRHAIYAASLGANVHAVDASRVACDVTAARAEAADCDSLISVDCAAIDADDLPDGRFDLVIDSYASCHVLDGDERLALLDALMSKLRAGGKLFTSGLATSDSFYERHVVLQSPGIAVDPANGIAKRLQDDGVAKRDGRELGRLVATTTERFADIVDGVVHTRAVHASVLCR